MQKCKNVFTSSVTFLTALFVALATLSCAKNFIKSLFSKNIAYRNGVFICLSAVLIATLICVIFLAVCKYIDKSKDKTVSRLTFLFFAVYIVGLTVVLCSFNVLPMTDSFRVEDQALAIAVGDMDQIDATPGTYFGNFSNNNLLVLIFIAFYKFLSAVGIENINYASILLNAVMLLIGEVLCYLGVRKLFNNRFACKYLVLSVINPIMYLTAPWVYSLSFCMPLMGGVFYLGACIYKQTSKYKLIIQSCGIGVLTVLGYFIRPVVVIVFIGYVVCLLLWMKKDKKKMLKAAVILVCCAVFIAVTYVSVSAIIKKICPDDSNSFPLTHWVLMGLYGDGTLNNKAEDITLKYDTKEERIQAHIDEIKRTMKSYTPLTFTEHLFAKFQKTWGVADSNFAIRLQQANKYTKLHSYIAGDKNIAFLTYCTAYRMAIYALGLIGLLYMLFKQRKANATFLPVMIIFGAIIFYLIWEAKESYCIPFLFLFVLMGADGGSAIAYAKFNLRKICKMTLSVCMCLTVVLSVINFSTFSLEKRDYQNLSVKCNNASGCTYVSDVAGKNNKINQRFFTSKSFDTIVLCCNPLSGDAIYDVVISDNENNILARRQISKDNISKSFLTVKFPAIKSSGSRQQYIVQITPSGDSTRDSIEFATYRYLRTKGYDGSLNVGGEDIFGDLRMNVYKAYKGVQLRPMLYIFAVIVLLVIQVFALICISKQRK